MSLKVISNYFWNQQGDFKPSSCIPLALFPITYFAVFKALPALCNQRISPTAKHLLSFGGSTLTAWAASQIFCQSVEHTSLKDRGYSLDSYEVGHEKAKEAFIEEMQKAMNLEATFVNADCAGWKSSKEEALDGNIFYWSVTNGVQDDIPNARRNQKRVHLFSAASQYNGSEATGPFTPDPGKAMIASNGDNTQGPLAQRTSPQVFEIVNALLANLGFNMLENVLPSAGESLSCGYLMPTDETIEQLANEFEANYAKIELPCYESRPAEDGGSVQLMLTAAPALHMSFGLLDKNSENSQKLQTFAYKATFYGLFKQTLTLLEKHPNKEVVLHITGTGLGTFECSEEVFAKEFKDVALHFQSQLTPKTRANVRVQFESYKASDALTGSSETYVTRSNEERLTVGRLLGLQEKERV